MKIKTIQRILLSFSFGMLIAKPTLFPQDYIVCVLLFIVAILGYWG